MLGIKSFGPSINPSPARKTETATVLDANSLPSVSIRGVSIFTSSSCSCVVASIISK